MKCVVSHSVSCRLKVFALSKTLGINNERGKALPPRSFPAFQLHCSAVRSMLPEWCPGLYTEGPGVCPSLGVLYVGDGALAPIPAGS